MEEFCDMSPQELAAPVDTVEVSKTRSKKTHGADMKTSCTEKQVN